MSYKFYFPGLILMDGPKVKYDIKRIQLVSLYRVSVHSQAVLKCPDSLSKSNFVRTQVVADLVRSYR